MDPAPVASISCDFAVLIYELFSGDAWQRQCYTNLLSVFLLDGGVDPGRLP